MRIVRDRHTVEEFPIIVAPDAVVASDEHIDRVLCCLLLDNDRGLEAQVVRFLVADRPACLHLVDFIDAISVEDSGSGAMFLKRFRKKLRDETRKVALDLDILRVLHRLRSQGDTIRAAKATLADDPCYTSLIRSGKLTPLQAAHLLMATRPCEHVALTPNMLKFFDQPTTHAPGSPRAYTMMEYRIRRLQRLTRPNMSSLSYHQMIGDWARGN